MNPYFYVSFK